MVAIRRYATNGVVLSTHKQKEHEVEFVKIVAYQLKILNVQIYMNVIVVHL